MDLRLYLAPTATVVMGCIATSLTAYLIRRQRKHVSIFTIRSEPLIAMKGKARKKVQVYFQNQIVEGTHLLHLSLENDGSVPIAVSDYQSPFQIKLNPGARILQAEIIETWPADLDRRIAKEGGATAKIIQTVDKNSIELTPILLNPRDEIVLQLLVENYNDHLEVNQHISGIKRVEWWSEPRSLSTALRLIGATMVIFSAFFLEPDAPYILTLPSVPYVLIIILGVLLYLTGIAWPRSGRTRFWGHSYAGQMPHEATTVSSEGA